MGACLGKEAPGLGPIEAGARRQTAHRRVAQSAGSFSEATEEDDDDDMTDANSEAEAATRGKRALAQHGARRAPPSPLQAGPTRHCVVPGPRRATKRACAPRRTGLDVCVVLPLRSLT